MEGPVANRLKNPVFLFAFNIKVYNDELPETSTTNYTTRTVTGGATYDDYPLAFNMDLKHNNYTIEKAIQLMQQTYVTSKVYW